MKPVTGVVIPREEWDAILATSTPAKDVDLLGLIESLRPESQGEDE